MEELWTSIEHSSNNKPSTLWNTDAGGLLGVPKVRCVGGGAGERVKPTAPTLVSTTCRTISFSQSYARLHPHRVSILEEYQPHLEASPGVIRPLVVLCVARPGQSTWRLRSKEHNL
jgi:hypothetical protein